MTRTAKVTVAWAAALAVLVVGTGAALADDPQSYVITYNLHEDPQDPESDLLWTFELAVEESDRANDDIGWEIKSVRFTHYDENEDPLQAWEDETVNVPTPDGLWWIEHADPDDPEAEEFDDGPALEGRATVDFGSDDDLYYEFDTDPHTEQPGDPQGVAMADAWVHLILWRCLLDPECLSWLISTLFEPEPVTIDDMPDQPIG